MNCNGEIEILFEDTDDSYVVAKALEAAGWEDTGSEFSHKGRTIFFKLPGGVDPKDYVPEPIVVNLPEPLQKMLDAKKKES